MPKVDATGYKLALQKVKQRDPEFYGFLEQQDADLLKFDISDDDEKAPSKDNENFRVDDSILASDADDSDEEEPDTDNEKIVVDEALENERMGSKKKYKRTLDEAIENVLDSDEESATDQTAQDDESSEELTEKMLTAWERDLSKKSYNQESARHLALAFKAVMLKSGCKVSGSRYVIKKPPVYDKALKLCFDNFPEACRKAVRRKSFSKNETQRPSLNFKSKTMKAIVKDYISDMIKFLPEVQNKSVLSMMLEHVKNMTEFSSMFPRKCRLIIKALVKIWNLEADEFKRRSFSCIFDLVSRLKDELFMFAFKRLYLSYSKCSTLKHSDVTCVDKLDYMQLSFADLCQVDPVSVYQNAFVYIRELAVQLRTAILSKKKEALKTVYSRSFMNLLYLWSAVLNKMRLDENVVQLMYPLVQVIYGCDRHITSNKYLPYRLHCLKCLLLLTKDTELYVPVFAIIIEILRALSVKRMQSKGAKNTDDKCAIASDLDKIVKLSISQLHDRSYKMAIVEKVADLLIVCLERFSSHPCFNELTFLLDLQLRKFCKESRLGNYKDRAFAIQCCERLKLITRRIEAHSKWIEFQKARSSIKLNDQENLLQIRQRLSTNSENLLLSFCNSVNRLNQRQQSIKMTNDSTVGQARQTEETKKRCKSQRQTILNKKQKAASKGISKKKKSD